MKEIEPIAYFRSPFTTKFGIPRQSGLVSELRGRIVFEPKFNSEDALRGLEGFDYVWLIWGFSANEPVGGKKWNEDDSLMVRPPRLGGNERVGVFASRSPFRPNGLGLSSVRIVNIGKDGVIEVSGADLMDGTPIYDVKPYLPYADAHIEARGGYTDSSIWQSLDVELPDNIGDFFNQNEIKALSEVLAQDPRPHYQHDQSCLRHGVWKQRCPLSGRKRTLYSSGSDSVTTSLCCAIRYFTSIFSTCGFATVGAIGVTSGAVLPLSGLEGTVTGDASSSCFCSLFLLLFLFRFPRMLFSTFSACFSSSLSNESLSSVPSAIVSSLTVFFSAKLESGSIEVSVYLGSCMWLK